MDPNEHNAVPSFIDHIPSFIGSNTGASQETAAYIPVYNPVISAFYTPGFPPTYSFDSSFIRFRQLPAIVRCYIWGLATESRVVEVRLPERASCNKHDFVSDMPVLIHTCRESRAVALKNYVELGNPNSLNNVYFHPQFDTLFIRGGVFLTAHISLLDYILPHKQLIQRLAVFGHPNDFMNITGFNSLREIIVVERKGAFLRHGDNFCNGSCSRRIARAFILPQNNFQVPNLSEHHYRSPSFWANENKRKGPTPQLLRGNPFFAFGPGRNVQFVWRRACLASINQENWYCHTDCECGNIATLSGGSDDSSVDEMRMEED